MRFLIVFALLSLSLWPQSQIMLLGVSNNGAAGGVGTKSLGQLCVNDSNFATVTTVTCTFSANVTAGSTVVCMVSWLVASQTLTSLTDNGSNTYTTIDAISTDTTGSGASFYAKNVAAANILTATFPTSSGAGHVISCMEVKGASTTAPLDGHHSNDQSIPGCATNSITSGSYTTTSNGDFLWGGTIDVNGQGDTFIAGTTSGAFTLENTDQYGQKDEQVIQTTAGSGTVSTFTDTQSGCPSSPIWLTFGAAFK